MKLVCQSSSATSVIKKALLTVFLFYMAKGDVVHMSSQQQMITKTHNNQLVVQPLRGLDAFSAPQQKRYALVNYEEL